MRMSSAMNVPVRPTPALEGREKGREGGRNEKKEGERGREGGREGGIKEKKEGGRERQRNKRKGRRGRRREGKNEGEE